MLTIHYHPLYYLDLSPPDYFLFPKLKMNLKGLLFVDVAWDPRSRNWWIKEGPKREFSAAFLKLYDRAKACIYIYTIVAYFEFKKKVRVFD